MSKTIDQKVVEMRFDNKHFESNVATSMSTLDKLKQKMSLKGLGKAAESEFASYTSGFISFKDSINKMWAGFEYDIANRMKSLARSFTIDPIKTGFNEYELKMGSVQTIMASTGESLETVNGYLEELNKYSDQTIYSFSDMTQNIGKFTNAGVKLEDAVLAIKGISNEAALSGANANEAARAMYNFSQALSAGYVKLIDWKSIENANMATVGFKEELIKTAVELGVVTKQADGMYKTLSGKTFNATKNFNDVLQEQWMTSDVLIKTLSKYADETTEIGKKATQAATEVKTFSMMMDTLKEAAQSGWAQTWEIIFGDFNEGKSLWTGLSNFFGDIIDKTSKARNNFLKGELDSSWDQLIDKVNEAGIETEHFQNGLVEVARKHNIAIDDMIEKEGSFIATLKSGWLTSDIIIETLKHFANGTAKTAESTEDMTSALEKYRKVVDEVWFGKYKNAPDRQKLLTDAGYDYAVVQALANKTMGKRKVTMQDLIETEGALSDAQLKNIGYTDKQIASIRALAAEAKESGTPINELINNMNRRSGRELMLESLARIGKSCTKIFRALGYAWKEVFPAKQGGLYNAIVGFNKFSESLEMNYKTFGKLLRTFKGVFAALDIILTLVTGPFKIAFKLLAAILKALDIPILDFTASIGDAIVAFDEWLNKIIDYDKAAKAIIKFFNKSKEALFGWIEALKKSDNIPRDIILGIVKGIGKFAHLVVESMINLGKTMLDTIKEILGIHSPSKEFFQIAWDCILGLIDGFKAGLSAVWKVVKKLGLGLIKILKQMNFGKIVAAAIGIGAVAAAFKLASAFEALTNPLEGLGEMFEGIGQAAKGLGAKFKGDALLSMAKAIGILALSLLGLAMAIKILGPGDMWHAIGMIAVLAAVLGILAFAMSKMSQDTVKWTKDDGFSSSSTSGIFAKIALAVLMIAVAIKLLSGLNFGEAVTAFIALAGIMFAMGLFFKAFSACMLLVRYEKGTEKLLTGLAFSMLLMVLVIKIAASFSEFNVKEITACVSFIIAIGGLFAAMTAIAKNSGANISKAGGMCIKMALALGLLVIAVKMVASLSNLNDKEVNAIMVFLGVLALACYAIIQIAPICAPAVSILDTLSNIALKLAAALILFVMAANFAKKVNIEDMLNAMFGLMGIMVVVSLMGIYVKVADENVTKLGSIAIKLSVALLMLAGVAMLLSIIPAEEAVRGVGLVLSLLMGLAVVLHVASKLTDAENLTKMLLKLAIAIGIMGGIIIVLSFLDVSNVMHSAMALAGAILALAGAIKMISNVKFDNNFMKNLIVMTVAIGVIGGALFLIGQLNPGNAMHSALALGIVLLALAGAMAIIGNAKFDAKLMANLIVMTVAIGVIGGALFLVGQLPVSEAMHSALALGIVLLALAGAMAIMGNMSGTVGGAGALIVASAAIAVLAISLRLLASLDVSALNAACIAIIAVVGVIVLLGVVVNSVPGLSIALIALGGAVALVGAGFLMAGAGFMLFANALTIMASVDLLTIASGMLVLAAALMALGIGGAVSYIVAPALFLLSAAFVTLSAASILLVIAAPMIMLLATALSSLASVDLLTIGAGLTVLAAGFALLGASSLMLIIAAPMIFLLAGALAALGVSSLLLVLTVPLISLLATALATLASVNIATLAISMAALGVALGGVGVAGVLLIIAVPLISKLAKSVKTLSETAKTAASGVKSLKSALSSLAKVNAISVALKIDKLRKSLSKLSKQAKGITSVATSVSLLAVAVQALAAAYEALKGLNASKIGTETASDYSKGVESANSAASSAGADLVRGFANGVRNSKHLARAAGNAVGQAAASGMRESLDINSPSRVGEEIGGFTGQGFINGLIKTQKSVYAVSKDTGNMVIKGISSTIKRISDAINTDIDSQPTIRPVLDLSDIKSGARSIGGMFPGGTVSVNTRTVGSIAASMAGYQNGNNSNEIVSGIKALRKDIANMPRNSYSINGITYDDGSNITSAVETLVRAARIERRA
jgi:tape measure domain-containing protein